MTGLDFFTRIYDPGSPLLVLDVGAHVGQSVASFLDLFPKAVIHAFEPAPANFSRLRDTFSTNPHVHPHHVAMGAKDGNVTLYLNNYDATHSTLPINPQEINRWADSADIIETAALEVEQRSIDSFVGTAALDKIDILKLDVQGGELAVLQGAQDALKSHRIGCIFTEVEFRQLYAGQPLAWDIHAFLSAHGYHFINFICPKTTDAGLLSWADAIYVNPTIWSQLAHGHSAGKMKSAIVH